MGEGRIGLNPHPGRDMDKKGLCEFRYWHLLSNIENVYILCKKNEIIYSVPLVPSISMHY